MLLRGLLIAMGVHMACLAGLTALRADAPRTGVRIASHRSGLVVLGRSRWGLQGLRHFSSWSELQAYFAKEGLALPQISHAYRNLSNEVRLEEGRDAAGLYYRVFWKSPQGEKVVHAPDLAAAEELSRHVRYQALEPSTFGYSISVN
jgi:hypothetical protein